MEIGAIFLKNFRKGKLKNDLKKKIGPQIEPQIGLQAGVQAQGSYPSASYPLSHPLFPDSLSSPGLDFCSEHRVKALVRQGSEAIYSLLENVRFDGNYYGVKCVRLGGWEYCWELAIRFQFFGPVQGMAVEPESKVFRGKKRIVYRSLVLINPYELWSEELVRRFRYLHDRLDFLVARILFHECIHVMVYLGKTFPRNLGHTKIFLEFREILQLSNSALLAPLRQEVLDCLYRLAGLASPSGTSSQKKMKLSLELCEFLLHEKYCIEKTDLAFGFSWNNSKIARDYARIAALNAGPRPPSNKKAWNRELLRLQEALRDLYRGIDRHLILE